MPPAAETSSGPLDEQLTARLLQQRIIVLGSEVDDRIANRLCAELLLLSAEDPRTLAMGLAASMGQFLLCAGAPGKRFSLPHAQVLMHQGSAGFGGTAADIEIYAGQLERTGRTVMGLIAQHTGQPLARVEQDSLRDRWFDAAEALSYGFIDHIVEGVADVRPAMAASAVGV